MKKKILASVMALVLTVAFATLPVSAANTSDTYTAPGEYSTTVTINGGSSTYSVTIPKTMSGTGKSGQISYDVSITADIAGNEVVNVNPDSTVTLSQSGKENVTATIAQTKTSFSYDDFSTKSTQQTTGTITYTGLSVGTWTGTFNFDISLTIN